MSVRTERRGFLLALIAGAAGCSADAVTESTPGLDTPGAFVALEVPTGGVTLLRTILALKLENQKVVLFMVRYVETPQTIEEARALARGAPLFSTQVELLLAEDFAKYHYEVVWFRTLTDEERDVVL